MYDKNNYSSAYDITMLSLAVLEENPISKIIGNSKEYKFTTNKREIVILNTNKLLNEEGFVGLKTGFTSAAGGCLSSLYKAYNK